MLTFTHIGSVDSMHALKSGELAIQISAEEVWPPRSRFSVLGRARLIRIALDEAAKIAMAQPG